MNSDDDEDVPDEKKQTIFYELLHSEELPANNRNLDHFLGEAQTIVGAGEATTSYYIHHTTWYVIARIVVPERHSRIGKVYTNVARSMREIEGRATSGHA
jgi:hypothetical protein